MRYVCSVAVGVALLSLVPPAAIGQQAGADLAITNYRFVSEVRYTRTQWFVTYGADLRNTGASRPAVTASVTSTLPTVQIVSGQGVLHFCPVPANSTVTSIDTFTILVDRSEPFDIASLRWTFVNPVANAGANQSARTGAVVTLNGSQSLNPSGVGTLSYRWAVESRPAGSQASLVNSNSAICSFTVDMPGAYVVSLTVDNGAAADKAAVQVSTINSPPVANAGISQTVPLNSTVTLNGGGSSDIDGDQLSYQWRLISYPPGSACALSNPRFVSPTFVVDKAGTYIAQLIVNDGAADSAPSTVSITTANTPPVANAGPSQKVTLGALVQLNAAASIDVDGDVLTYHWSLITAPAGSAAALSNPSAVNPTFTADLAGGYVAQVIVNDGKIDSAPATVSIETKEVQPPVANVGPNQTVVHGAIVNLSGSCTDPQQLSCTGTWSLITRPEGSAATLLPANVMNPTFVADLPGTYIAQLIVTNGVRSSDPATTTITTTNSTPVAKAGENRNVFTKAVVALDGSQSSDADHDHLSYSWSLLAKPEGSTAVLQAPTSAAPSFFADLAGTYVAQLIVNDGLSNSIPATVTITASAMAIALSPSPLNLFNAPVTLTITLSAPAGPGGLPLSLTGFDPQVVSLPVSAMVPANSTGVNVTVTPLALGSTNLTVSAAGYQPASTTVTVTTPRITLSSNLTAVGVSRSIDATVKLSAPALAGGASVSLSGGAGTVGFDPQVVTIPAGQTTGSFKILGVAEGSATITAAANGYLNGTLPMLVVRLGSIVLPANLTVAPGQSVALDVRLVSPAPVSGVTVALASGNSSILTVSPSVFIPEGATGASIPAQVTGVAFGATTISASSPGLTGDSQTVKVGASLSFSTQAVTVGAGGVRSVTLLLSAPAPAGGLTIALQSTNPAVASVPASVTIDAHTSSANVSITGGTEGTATISASSSAPNVSGASVLATVHIYGAISAPANLSVGLGQSAAFPISLSSPAPDGGITATLACDATGKVSISPATVTFAAGKTVPDAQPQVSGALLGASTVTVSAPGYSQATGNVSVGASLSVSPSPLSLSGAESRNLSITLSAPAPADMTINLSASPSGIITFPGTVTIARNATSATASVTGAGAGSATLTAAAAAANVTSGTATVNVTGSGALSLASDSTVGLGQSIPVQVSIGAAAPAGGLVVSLSSNAAAVGVSPATVTIPSGQTQATAQLTGKDVGSAEITASSPFYTSAKKTVAVTATISISPQSLGIDTGETKTLTLTLSGPAPTGGISFSLTTSDAGRVTVGAPSVTIPANATTATFQITGVAMGSAVVRAHAANLTDATASITVTQSIDIIMPATLTVAPGDVVPLSIKLARTYPSTVNLVVTTSDGGKATIWPTTITVPAGQTLPSSIVQVTGAAAGSAVITVSSNGGVSLNPASTTVTVGYTISLSPSTVTIPGINANGFLTISLSGPAPAGGVEFTLTSSNPGVVTVPPDVFLSATSTSMTVRLTSVSAGSSVIRVRAAGMADATADVVVVPPGSVLVTGPSSIALNQSANLSIALSTAAPAGGVTVELTTSNPKIVGLSQSSITVPAGATTPASALQIIGVNAGAATINASATGYSAGSPLSVNVTAAVNWVTPTATIVGEGHQANLLLRLSGIAPMDGLTVNLSSSNPAAATVPQTATFNWDAGNSPTISIPVTSVGVGTTSIHAGKGTNIPDVVATVTVVAPLSITTTSLSNGTAGAPYSATVSATGGTPTYAWSATGLPAGLSINATTGVISGTTSAIGTSNVTVSVDDSTSPVQHATKQLSLTIGTGVSITTASLPNGSLGVAYSAPMAAAGGTSPYSWSATGLPQGLTINATTGTISGTPSAPGSASVRVTVTDSTSPTNLSSFKDFTFTIAGGGLDITTTSLPAGSVGAAYSAPVTATGGTPSYTWTATGLPNGLSINPNTGVISGTPTAAGSSSVTVTVTDSASPTKHTASKTLPLEVVSGMSISTSQLPVAGVGAAYSATLAAVGGTPSYTWSASGLPEGLSIAPTTGVISGTTWAPGSFPVTFTVADSATPHLTASRQITLTAAYTLTLSPPSITIRGYGNFATLNLMLSGPAPAGGIEFTLSSSNTGIATVPSFVPLSANSSSVGVRITSVAAGTAVIHVNAPGIPEATATVTVLAPGSVVLTGPATLGLSTTGTLNVSLSAAAPAGGVTVNLATSDAGKVRLVTSSVFIAEGKTAPDAQPQVFAENVGAASITTTAGGYTASAPLTINVNATVTWITQNATIAGIGNQTLLTLRLSAAAPQNQLDGVMVNLTSSNPGVATIQPTGIFIWDGSTAPGIVIPVTSVSAGTTTIHASGVNIPDATTTVTVVGPVGISTTSLPNGAVGGAYNATLTAAGGTPSYTWSATGLPAGLSINSTTGVISGTPTAAGNNFVNVTVTDSSSPTHQTASHQFTLTITVGVAITTTALPAGITGTPYNAPLAATGGAPPYAWSATGLPAGLSVDSTAGAIIGTPTAAGSATVTVTAADATSPTHLTASSQFTINVAQKLVITTTALADCGLPCSTGPVTATGGVAPYQWAVTGLPAGWTFNSTTGMIAGSGSYTGPVTLTFTVTDSWTPTAQTATKQLTFTARAGLAITTASLPDALATSPYSTTLTASGGTPSYSWSASGLPTGLSINSTTGVISGTPAAAGTPSVTVTVTDTTTPTAQTISKTFTLTVRAGVSITTQSLPDALATSPYSTPLAASGGTPSYSWSASGLPNGLTINSTTGVISGTPAAAGSPSVTVTVTDSTSPTHQTASKTFTLTVRPAVSISTTSLPGGVVGSAYSATVAASGGTAGYSWSATGLPNGLAINSTTGVISGSPTVAGSNTVTVTVTDSTSPTPQTASKQFSVPISAVFAITTPSLPDGIATIPYSATVTATGGTPSYSWSATGLPNGLTINSSTGVISGTTTVTGPVTANISVVDSSTPARSANKQFTFTIRAALSITTTSLANGVATSLYSATVAATGGIPSYTWSASGLPTGLGINTSTGVISGTPTAGGTPSVTVTVTDSTTPTHQTASKTYTLTIANAPAINAPSFPVGAVGAAYSVTVTGTGGTPTYTWAATGLPGGLTINSATGAISGTPTAAGSFVVNLTMTDSTLPTHLMATAQGTIVIRPSVTVSTTSLPDGLATSPYSATVVAGGGVEPYTWSATGLPSGLSINSSTGVISGTPAAGATSSVTVTVKDSSAPTVHSDSKVLSLTIKPAVSINAGTLPGGFTGFAYSASVSASGGTPSYSWSATGLPAGLTINSATGAISGTPTATGSTTVNVLVTDSTAPTHQTATRSFPLTIVQGLTITSTSLPDAYTNVLYSASVAATGGTSPYSWSASGLPAGLTMNATTGAISGTATTAATVTVRVTATDSTAGSALTVSKDLSLTVKPGVAITTTSLPSRPAGSPYSATLAAAGGTPSYTWAATGLPTGFAINATTGAITGSPTAPSTSTVHVTVTDSTAPTHLTATKDLTLTITAQLSITTTTLPTGPANSPYSATVVAAGGTPNYTWAATGLPNGLTINASTGVISGTPTAATSGNVNITVTDSTAPTPQTATTQLTLTISPKLSITTTSLPTNPAGSVYSATVTATGGTPSYTWSATGLPTGFTIDPISGTISGNPAAPVSGSVTVTVTDTTSPTHQTDTKTFTLTITAALSISTTSLPAGQVNTAYSSTVAAAGGTTPYVWSATGLPAGFAINATTGEISGNPTVASTSTVSVTVTDATKPIAQTKVKDFTLTIDNALTITTGSLPNGAPGVAYTPFQMSAAGGISPYSWSAPDLPRNLTISSTGIISGTPLNAGTTLVHFTVTDTSNPVKTATKTLSLTIVSPPLSVDPATPPTGVINTAYTFQPTASGGLQPYNWTATGLAAAGLQINNVTGLITGTPTATGSYSVRITVTDTSSPVQTAYRDFTITIATVPPNPNNVITVSNANLGLNLQTQVTITLSPAPIAAVTLTITSDNADVRLGSSDSVGETTLSTTLPANTTSVSTYVKGYAASGTAHIKATVLGYPDGVGTVTLYPAGFVLASPEGIGAAYTTYQGVRSALTVYPARLDSQGRFAESQQIRGQYSISVPLSNAPAGYGVVSPASVAFSGGMTSADAAFTASTTTTGVTTISAGAPYPFTLPASGSSVVATILASGILPCDALLAVGKNLQKNTCAQLTGTTLSPVPVTIHSNSTKLKFSTTPGGTPTDTILVTIPANQKFTPDFYAHAYDSAGVVTYTVSATGYGSTELSVTLSPSGFVIQTPFGLGANFIISLGSPNPTLGVFTARFDTSGAPIETQAVAGGATVSATVTSSAPTVGSILTSPVTIGAGAYSASTNFHAATAGTTTITAAAAGWTSGTVQATVQAPTLVVTGGITIGNHLQDAGTLILPVPAPAGGLHVTIQTPSSLLKFTTDPTKAGNSSIGIDVPEGQQIATYYIQSLGSSGTVAYSATAPGYSAGNGSINLAPSGIVIFGPGQCSICFVSASGGDQPLTVYTAQLDANNTPVNPQALAGGAALSVSLGNTNRAAGTVPGSVLIAPNTFSSTLLFSPAGAGTTDVSAATPTGWDTANKWTKVTMSVQ